MEFIPLPPGPYACIVADPPWRFNDQGTRASPEYSGKQRRKSHYKTLSLEQIARLPVKDVAAEDSWLFLWIPESLRESAYRVTLDFTDLHIGIGYHHLIAEAWGFKVTGAVFIWFKGRPILVDENGKETTLTNKRRPISGADIRRQIGIGHYSRPAHEIAVICKRGKPIRESSGEPSIIIESRSRHSKKPAGFFTSIERYCPGPRLELFAREPREGWDVWGDEVDRSG